MRLLIPLTAAAALAFSGTAQATWRDRAIDALLVRSTNTALSIGAKDLTSDEWIACRQRRCSYRFEISDTRSNLRIMFETGRMFVRHGRVVFRSATLTRGQR